MNCFCLILATMALSSTVFLEAEAGGMSSLVVSFGYHTQKTGGAIKDKIAHTYKCKNPHWLRPFLGKYNHYEKFEYHDDCENILGCNEGADSCEWSGESMILADDACDYTPKRTYAFIKAQQDRELRLDHIDLGLWSSDADDGNGFRLRLYLANLRISQSTDRSSGGSDYDEIYLEIDHEDSSFSVQLKRDSSTVKTLQFDANGMCTNCDEQNFSETGNMIGWTQNKINPTLNSNDELVHADLEWKGKDCSYPVYYCASGRSDSGNIVNCWN